MIRNQNILKKTAEAVTLGTAIALGCTCIASCDPASSGAVETLKPKASGDQTIGGVYFVPENASFTNEFNAATNGGVWIHDKGALPFGTEVAGLVTAHTAGFPSDWNPAEEDLTCSSITVVSNRAAKASEEIYTVVSVKNCV